MQLAEWTSNHTTIAVLLLMGTGTIYAAPRLVPSENWLLEVFGVLFSWGVGTIFLGISFSMLTTMVEIPYPYREMTSQPYGCFVVGFVLTVIFWYVTRPQH